MVQLIVKFLCSWSLFAHLIASQFLPPSHDDRNDNETISNLFTTDSKKTHISNERVKNPNGPTVVTVNGYIRRIIAINDIKNEYKLQITFRQMWNDDRLSLDSIDVDGMSHRDTRDYVDSSTNENIWRPDTFFQNEKDAHRHEIEAPNSLIRIYRNGTILYSVRLTLSLFCDFDLKYYPFDVQYCNLDLSSYRHATRDIVYQWKSDDPVQIRSTAYLQNFELKTIKTENFNTTTSTGEYSSLRVVFEFSRHYTFAVFQVYIPSSMIVIVSWLTFWLHRSAISSRITLGMCSLLAMLMLSIAFNFHQPSISITRSIDTWIGTCLAFIFFALIASIAAVNQSNRKEKQLIGRNRNNETNDAKRKRIKMNIDVIARVAFPIAYILFVVSYFAYNLH